MFVPERVYVVRLKDALRIVEHIRLTLRRSTYREAVVEAYRDIYESAFDLLARWNERVPAPEYGRLALWILESMHRSALGDVAANPSLDLPSEVLSAIEVLDSFERRLPERSDEATQDLYRTEHRVLAERISEVFSAALRTEEIDTDALLANHAGSFAILYECSRDSTGWVIRCAALAGSQVHLHVARLTDAGAENLSWFMSPVGVLDALQHGERRQIAFLCNYVNLSQAVWLRISRALMPSALAELLYPEVAGQVSTVRVVPDGPVSRLPLAGLTLPDGRQLIDIADVTLLPSLSMLQLTTTDNPADRPPRSVSLHLDESLARVEEEVAAWSNATPATRIARTATRADFLASLRGDPPPDAVVVSAHGDGDPIEWGAALHLADASDVSAGVALGLPWPGIVLLGSCWLGEVQTVKGSEPLGFPIACMLRGARLVVGGFAPIRQGEASQVLAQVARTIGTRPPGPGLAWDAVRDLLARRPELRAEPPSAWAVLTQWSLIVAQQERPLATAPVQIGAEDAPDVEAEDVELALDLASCLSDIGEIPGISDALLRLLEAVGAGGSPITTRLLLRELLEREAEWERFALAIEYAHLADSSVNVEARGPWFLLRLPSGPAAPFTAPACLSLPTALGAARLLRDEFVMPRHLLHAIATDPMSDAHATVTRILGSGGQRVEALLADQVFWEDVPTNQSARHAGFRALARAGYAPTSYPAPPGVPDLPDLLQDARPGPWQPAAALALAGLLLGLSLNTLGTAQAFVHGRGYLGAALSLNPPWRCPGAPGMGGHAATDEGLPQWVAQRGWDRAADRG